MDNINEIEVEDRASAVKGLLYLLAGVVIAAILAFGLTPFVKAIPWKWEEKLGKNYNEDLDLQTCRAQPDADKLLSKLVQRIYPLEESDKNFSINVHVSKDPSVNAYAQLGGTIMIHKGLLAQAKSPEEVAGVLAHEIEHVKQRHIFEKFLVQLITNGGISAIFSGDAGNQYASYFLNMHFSRTQEAQADKGGLKRLAKAKVDVAPLEKFFERLDDDSTLSDFVSDHPDSASRERMIEEYKASDATPIMSKDEWLVLKHYCKK
jgi:predicted Zn-dependent protease